MPCDTMPGMRKGPAGPRTVDEYLAQVPQPARGTLDRFPNHCSLYPMSTAVMEAFRKDLEGFETSKGTIRFPVDKPLPAALVKRLVKARLAENRQREQR